MTARTLLATIASATILTIFAALLVEAIGRAS